MGLGFFSTSSNKLQVMGLGFFRTALNKHQVMGLDFFRSIMTGSAQLGGLRLEQSSVVNHHPCEPIRYGDTWPQQIHNYEWENFFVGNWELNKNTQINVKEE
ncbi:hypothetical protein SLA2020_100980 [Shorea laevis]